MNTLEPTDLRPSALTLQEAMSSMEKGLEGTMFLMKFKS